MKQTFTSSIWFSQKFKQHFLDQIHQMFNLGTFMSKLLVTLPETNIAPKNGWLEYYFPIGEAYSQGLC